MILLTIVHSDRTLLIPIIYEFKERITHHIVLHDEAEEDRRLAKELVTGIRRMNEAYGLDAQVERLMLDEDSSKDLESLAQKIRSEKKGEIYFNAAGADLSLVVRLSSVVLQRGGTILAYDKNDNSYNLIRQDRFENRSIRHSMKIRDFLMLMGEKILFSGDKNAVRERRKALELLFSDSRKMFEIRRLLLEKKSRKLAELPRELLEAMKELDIMEHPGRLAGDLSQSRFGLLFEEYLFLQMDRFDFDDIQIGVKIAFERRERPGDFPLEVQNEFDLLTIRENRLGFVESKIGDRIDPLSVIYKSDALMDYFGDDSRSLIVNIQPERAGRNREEPTLLFGETFHLRAQSKRIGIYNDFDLDAEKFGRRVREIFGARPRRFLLGGYDLEMATIKQVLRRTGQLFHDRRLAWGAKLSDYADLLNDEEHFYAIELEIDMEPPPHFTLIDHHNERQEDPSALEQVLDLLDVPPNRFYELVSLNDKGYIPAMQAYGATEEEIARIRRLDRLSQGVSEEEEQEAERLLETAKKLGDLYLIHSTIEHFSPIVDRLPGHNLLIYTDRKLTYYGEKIHELLAAFSDRLKENVFYYGGGYGFLGVPEGRMSEEELTELREELLDFLVSSRY